MRAIIYFFRGIFYGILFQHQVVVVLVVVIVIKIIIFGLSPVMSLSKSEEDHKKINNGNTLEQYILMSIMKNKAIRNTYNHIFLIDLHH